MDDARARALLNAAPYLHMATTTADGVPVLRVVHTVSLQHDGAIYFHASPAGEKMECVGRAAVMSTSRAIATVPSYFVDAERACPATTYYESVQAHGTLVAVENAQEKAAVLAALMAKLQAEGGHVPIDPTRADYAELYEKAVRGIAVVRLDVTRVDGKHKVGQNKTPDERVRILEGFWKRGATGDVEAIEAVVAGNAGTPLPAFLRVETKRGVLRVRVAFDAALCDAAARLLEGAYWLEGFACADVARAFATSRACVAIENDAGEVVAAARAGGDARAVTLCDVMVRPDWRDHGLGQRVVEATLDHPGARDVAMVRLRTRDAHGLYARLGFRDAQEAWNKPWTASEMVRSTR